MRWWRGRRVVRTKNYRSGRKIALGFQWVSLLPPLGKARGQRFVPHQSQPRRRAGWWKAVERVFSEEEEKVFNTTWSSELFEHFLFSSSEHWHRVVLGQAEKVTFTEITVKLWEKLRPSLRQWYVGCTYSESPAFPWQEVGDVVLPGNFSEPALQTFSIPQGQSTDLVG